MFSGQVTDVSVIIASSYRIGIRRELVVSLAKHSGCLLRHEKCTLSVVWLISRCVTARDGPCRQLATTTLAADQRCCLGITNAWIQKDIRNIPNNPGNYRDGNRNHCRRFYRVKVTKDR